MTRDWVSIRLHGHESLSASSSRVMFHELKIQWNNEDAWVFFVCNLDNHFELLKVSWLQTIPWFVCVCDWSWCSLCNGSCFLFSDVVSRNDNWCLRDQRSWFGCHLACTSSRWGGVEISANQCWSEFVIPRKFYSRHMKLKCILAAPLFSRYDVHDELIFHAALGTTKFESWGKSFWVNRCALSQRFEFQSCQWKYHPLISWDLVWFESLA